MRSYKALSVLAVLGLAACGDQLNVPDYYAGSIDELTNGTATPTLIATAVQGIPAGTRSAISGTVITWGEVGREGYSLDPANPENQTRRLKIEDASIASGTWSTGYQNIRMQNIILKAVESSKELTNEQKEGIRGWTKTWMAHDLLIMNEVFDKSGIAIDVDVDVDAALPPIVTKEQAYTRIVQLLDQAKTHLAAAGAKFAFDPGPGYAAPLNTPAGFIKVNRAIKSRVDVYMKNWGAALSDVNESFIDPNAAMNFGAYAVYSTRSGDNSNPLYDPVPRTQVAHQSIIPDAQKRADGTPDLRATTKTAVITTRLTNGITVDRKWTVYNSAGDPVPVVKNEELLLIRAEANIQLGNLPAAVTDLNVVREKSGGLPPYAGPQTKEALIDELLYNRRYSLLWEGAHRWIDMRRYDRLTQLPRYAPDHKIFQYAPLPDVECQARDPKPTGCSVPPVL